MSTALYRGREKEPYDFYHEVCGLQSVRPALRLKAQISRTDSPALNCLAQREKASDVSGLILLVVLCTFVMNVTQLCRPFQKVHEMLKKGWDAEGSPFRGQKFDPSMFNISPGAVHF